MNRKDLNHFRPILERMAERLEIDTASVVEQTRNASGGQGTGEPSNAPQHLGEGGSVEYLHDLNATLLENEQHLAEEVIAALNRIRTGSFGRCERCQAEIPRGRLDAIPHTRYCVGCAETIGAGAPVNLNVGRPRGPDETLAPEGEMMAESDATVDAMFSNSGARRRKTEAPDSHAVGTPGGGTAVGGLAGSNSGSGEPDMDELNEASANGNSDAQSANPQDLEDSRDDSRPKGKSSRRLRQKF